MNSAHLFLKKTFPVLLSLVLLTLTIDAQTVVAADYVNPDTQSLKIPDVLFNPEFWIVFLVASVILFAILSLAYSVRKLSKILYASQIQETIASEVVRESSWKKLMIRLTRSVPVEQEEDVMLDHDYDGIRELDNKLPPWWVFGFYVTIIIAVVYIFNYHIAKTSKLQIAEYNTEMLRAEADKVERAKIGGNNINQENVKVLADPVSVEEGKEIFTKNCVACHGNAGQGNVGPNFTDQYWIHGGGIKNIFATISDGVPQKGMISWKNQLAPSQIQKVASFILTLQGTNPPGAKEPQGDLYIESVTDSSGKATGPAIDSTFKSKLKI